MLSVKMVNYIILCCLVVNKYFCTKTVYSFFMSRIVETTSSSRPPEAESDSAGEGTEPKETAGILSPERDVAMATSGMATAERDQAFDTEKLEIIASTFEEICVFLYQAKNLIVSVQFVSIVQT